MALLDPSVEAIAPPPRPAADRAPDWVAAGTPEPLRSDLEALLGPGRVLGRASDLIRYASDASPYRRIPRAVVVAGGPEDVGRLLAYGRRAGVPVVLRAGGTSLNGQAQSDGILVDVRRDLGGVAVEEDGALCRVGPGTVLGHANRVLAPHGRRLGPDPASTDIACAGGVIANNSGGMRCGVVEDAYRTVRSLTFVLPSGTTIDTAAPGAAERFASAEPELAAGLGKIRDEIRADGELSERIRRKFEIKNTTGYRLCAFLDADEPLEIFRRLLVGSEGTLAFIGDAAFETVPVPPLTTTSWLHFPGGIDTAVVPVTDLVAAGATAVELMVAPALMVAAHNIPGTPEWWKEMPLDSAALLVEFGAADEAGLEAHEARAAELLSAPRAVPPARVQPRPGADRARLAGARGPARAGRAAAAARDGADRRGRLRAPRSRWRRPRVRSRRCSESTASSPASPATPPPATSTSCSPPTSPSPRTSSATRRSWRGWSSSSSTATTARSRPSTGPGSTWRPTSSASGARRRPR